MLAERNGSEELEEEAPIRSDRVLMRTDTYATQDTRLRLQLENEANLPPSSEY